MVGFGQDVLTLFKTPIWFTGSVDARHIAQPTAQPGETSMSIRTSAKSIGNNDSKSEALAASIRKSWGKAKPEKQAEIRLEFMVGYIAGRERISLSEAQAIVEAGKGSGAINPGAIDRATSGFRYHVMQGKTKPEPKTSKRYSPELRKAAQAYLAKFDSVGEAIAVLRAVAK
jgi:hypothetical protein